MPKWAGIPLCILALVAGVGIWFIPFATSGNSFLDSEVVKIVIRIMASYAAFTIGLDLITWMTKGDK